MSINKEMNKIIWIGLAKIESEKQSELLGFATKAYVTVLGRAENRKIFRSKVKDYFLNLNLQLLRLEEVEQLNSRIQHFTVEQKILDLAKQLHTGINDIKVSTFHTYN